MNGTRFHLIKLFSKVLDYCCLAGSILSEEVSSLI